MEQITGLLWLILGNQAENEYWKTWCYILAGYQLADAFLKNPIAQAFIRGLKGE